MTSMSLADYRKQFSSKTKKINSRKRTKPVTSAGEATLSLQLKAMKINFEREFKFCPDRKWKADFYLIGRMVLIEVEGGIWSGGRHTRGKGYIGDMEKYNTAQNLGYKVLRFSTEQVKSGLAIRQIGELI